MVLLTTQYDYFLHDNISDTSMIPNDISVSSDSDVEYESDYYFAIIFLIILLVPVLVVCLYQCLWRTIRCCKDNCYRQFEYRNHERQWMLRYRAFWNQNRHIRLLDSNRRLNLSRCHDIVMIENNPETTAHIARVILPWNPMQHVVWNSNHLPDFVCDNSALTKHDIENPATQKLLSSQQMLKIYWNGTEKILSKQTQVII